LEAIASRICQRFPVSGRDSAGITTKSLSSKNLLLANGGKCIRRRLCIVILQIVLMLFLIIPECSAGWSFGLVEVKEPEKVTIPANEILDKIKNNKTIYYKDVIIIGDLNINSIDLPTENVALTKFREDLPEYAYVVSTPITIEESHIIGNISSNNIIFKKSFALRDVNVSGGIDMEGSRFCWNASFERSE
jgi:hypothetical protein